MEEALKQAICIIGGVSAVARLFGISVQAVSKWRRAPAERVLLIEHETLARGNQISRYRLRPDVFGTAPILVALEPVE